MSALPSVPLIGLRAYLFINFLIWSCGLTYPVEPSHIPITSHVTLLPTNTSAALFPPTSLTPPVLVTSPVLPALPIFKTPAFTLVVPPMPPTYFNNKLPPDELDTDLTVFETAPRLSILSPLTVKKKNNGGVVIDPTDQNLTFTSG